MSYEGKRGAKEELGRWEGSTHGSVQFTTADGTLRHELPVADQPTQARCATIDAVLLRGGGERVHDEGTVVAHIAANAGLDGQATLPPLLRRRAHQMTSRRLWER